MQYDMWSTVFLFHTRGRPVVSVALFIVNEGLLNLTICALVHYLVKKSICAKASAGHEQMTERKRKGEQCKEKNSLNDNCKSYM